MGEQEGHLPYFYYKSKCRGGKSEDDRLPSPGGDSGEQASEREQGSEQDGKGADVGHDSALCSGCLLPVVSHALT